MALTTQNFEKGVDFTGINPATAGNHNNLVDLAEPKKMDNDNTIGAGLPIVTKDSALDTPVVPDANTNPQWKRYIWCRRPFAGASDKSFKFYGWNDDATAHATLLKWVESPPSNATIAALANNALATAQNAETTANVAAVSANVAAVSAAAAVVTANAANTNANTAITNAATAQTTANAAGTAAATAQSSAEFAATLALGRKDIDDTLNPGTAYQRGRTNAAATAWELFSVKDTYAKLTETQNKGTDAGGSSAGKNTRVLNTEDSDSGNLVSLAAGIVTIANAGTYYIRAWAIMFDNGNNTHQLLVVKDSDNSTLLTGRSMTFVSGGSIGQVSEVSGLITATAGMTIRLDHYITNAQATNGLGQAANIHPDAGGKEVYSCLELNLC